MDNYLLTFKNVSGFSLNQAKNPHYLDHTAKLTPFFENRAPRPKPQCATRSNWSAWFCRLSIHCPATSYHPDLFVTDRRSHTGCDEAENPLQHSVSFT